MLSAEVRARQPELQTAWSERRNLRIADVLDDEVADALERDLQQRPYSLRAATPSRFNYQYYELDVAPCDDCEHPLCRFARWWWSDGGDWLSSLTGMDLGPPDDGHIISTVYRRGCYLDVHSDGDERRQLAFVLGLTRGPLPRRAGGDLEFIDVEDGRVRVSERRAPGWNTLDIFDVTEHRTLHRVSMVTQPCDRRALSGWFWLPR